MIRDALPTDGPSICDIYNYYVKNTVVTFEEEAVGAEAMAERIARVTASLPWLLWEEGGRVLGYCYASPWKERSAYRYSVETTVYLGPGNEGRGLGSLLYGALIPELGRRGLHQLLAGIALPNERSVRLHERLGFVKTGELVEVGFKFGRWIDVGYWQLGLPAGSGSPRA